jgi:hypothetical protein
MQQAVDRHGDGITMPGECRSLIECFSEHNDRLVFWFNASTGSTHAIIENEINNTEGIDPVSDTYETTDSKGGRQVHSRSTGEGDYV